MRFGPSIAMPQLSDGLILQSRSGMPVGLRIFVIASLLIVALLIGRTLGLIHRSTTHLPSDWIPTKKERTSVNPPETLAKVVQLRAPEPSKVTMEHPQIRVEDRRVWYLRSTTSGTTTSVTAVGAHDEFPPRVEFATPDGNRVTVSGVKDIRAFSDLLLEVEQFLGTWPFPADDEIAAPVSPSEPLLMAQAPDTAPVALSSLLGPVGRPPSVFDDPAPTQPPMPMPNPWSLPWLNRKGPQ